VFVFSSHDPLIRILPELPPVWSENEEREALPVTSDEKGALPIARRPLTRPTIGIAACCARTSSGHAAAAPPSVARNVRRAMWLAM
jgi:hypothetical protein